MATVAAEVVSSAPVDKVRLCELLGWSRPTLDKRLREDQNFPVLQAGEGRGKPWQFDPAAVLAYVQHGTLSHERAPAAPAAPAPVAKSSAPKTLRDIPGAAAPVVRDTSGRVVNGAEVTAKARKEHLQADLAEDKLRVSRGQLVDAEHVRITLTTAFAHLGKALDGLADNVAKRLALSDTGAIVVRELTDDMRRQLHSDLRLLVQDE